MGWQSLFCAYERRSFPQQPVEKGHALAETLPKLLLCNHPRKCTISHADVIYRVLFFLLGSSHLPSWLCGLVFNPVLVLSTRECWDLWGDPTRHPTGVAPTRQRKEGHKQRFGVVDHQGQKAAQHTASTESNRARSVEDGA